VAIGDAVPFVRSASQLNAISGVSPATRRACRAHQRPGDVLPFRRRKRIDDRRHARIGRG